MNTLPAPIALQLYTVREALAKDFTGVIQKVAQMGYAGVETAGFPGTTPQAASRLFKSLGLEAVSAHTALPVGEKKGEVLDTARALGCKYIVSGRGPDEFKTLDHVRRTCDLYNQASAFARANGLAFAIHNHWWEFETLEPGRSVFQVMLENLDPAVLFEIDVYWAQTAGVDPARVVKDVGRRAPLLHIKDGPCVKGQPMVAVGEGRVDFPPIVKAGAGATEWLIVELDECATDMLEAVEKSYRFLVKHGLGRGHTN